MCFLKLPFSEKLLSQCSHLKGFFPSFFKVQIFWEGRKVLQNLHLRFDAHYIESSVSWWFHKILWPQLHLKPHNYIPVVHISLYVVDQCGAPILRCGLHKNIMDCFIPPDFFAIPSWKMSLLFSGHRCRTEHGIMSNGICLIFLQFKYYLKLDPSPHI